MKPCLCVNKSNLLACIPLALEILLSTWMHEMEVPSCGRAVSWKGDGTEGETAIPLFSIHCKHPLAWKAVSWREGGRGGEGGETSIPSLSSSRCPTSRGSLVCSGPDHEFTKEGPCLLWLLHKFHFLTGPLVPPREGRAAHTNPPHPLLYLLNCAQTPLIPCKGRIL